MNKRAHVSIVSLIMASLVVLFVFGLVYSLVSMGKSRSEEVREQQQKISDFRILTLYVKYSPDVKKPLPPEIQRIVDAK